MDNQLWPSQDLFWSLLSKKLADEATPEELQELQSILLRNPELQHRADMLGEMWQQQKEHDNSEDESAYMRHFMKYKDELFHEDTEEIALPVYTDEPYTEKQGWLQSLFSKRNLTMLSFVVLILLGSTITFFMTKNNPAKTSSADTISSVVTKNGNRTKIVLSDGSEVWLNAGSHLDYNNADFNKTLREVTLSGEAFFDVTKNADKPFIIHTKKMDIKVIGTAFNVRSYDNEKMAEASLIRGSIEVTLKDRKGQKVTLTPNEKISVANAEEALAEEKPVKTKAAKKTASPSLQFGVMDLKPNPTNNIIGEIAWTQNRLYFENERLEDIGLMIERWFGIAVEIKNESLKNARYTGNFENETIEEVLSSLKLSKAFSFRMENHHVIINY